jgi:hypothetical protein
MAKKKSVLDFYEMKKKGEKITFTRKASASSGLIQNFETFNTLPGGI